MEDFDFRKELERDLSDFIDEEWKRRKEKFKDHKFIGAVKEKGIGDVFTLDISENDDDSTNIKVLAKCNTLSEFTEIGEINISKDKMVHVFFDGTSVSVEGLEDLSKLLLEIKMYVEKNIINKGEK